MVLSSSSSGDQIANLNNEVAQLKAMLLNEREKSKSIEKFLTEGQLRKLKTGKQIQWSIQDVSSAISLYAAGPRAYRLLRKRNYPLPGVSTLRRWASKINMQKGMTHKYLFTLFPGIHIFELNSLLLTVFQVLIFLTSASTNILGILNVVLALMKHTALTKMERACVLLFDEMKIQSSYEYDKNSDTTLGPSKYVQVVMARGICGKWKQPIFYNYDCKMTKTLLFKIITKLENIGYPVYAINCDLGGSNRGLWSALNISEQQIWFENPESHKKVYVFADAPHMIKLLRNHFLDTGFSLNNKIINVKPIVDLLQHTTKLDLNIAHKINKDFLTVKGAQRQKVKLATKLFSHTVSKAVTRLGLLNVYENENNWLECSQLLKITNDWFDVFNSKVPESDSRNRVKAYGLALNEQNEILNKMETTMSDLRKIGSKHSLPFQRGIIIAIRSLKQLFIDMKSDFGIRYILTYHLNQDPLESLFSIIRAIGGLYDHPTALQFKYRLRNYLMGRNDDIISENSNVEQGSDTPNLATENISSGNDAVPAYKNDQDDCTIVTGQMFNALEVPIECEDKVTEEEEKKLYWDGLENLAGFVAFKLRTTETLGYFPKQDDANSSWINHLSEGGLQKPKPEFLLKCRELDDIFENYNGFALKLTTNYMKNLLLSAKHVDLSDHAKALFFKCKMYFKIRTLNRDLQENSKVKKRKIIKVIK